MLPALLSNILLVVSFVFRLSLELSLPKCFLKPSYAFKFHAELLVRVILCVAPKPQQTHSLMGKRLSSWQGFKLSTVKKREIKSAEQEVTV